MAVISLNNAKEQRQYSRNEIACLAAGVDPMQKQNETPYEKKREVVDWLCIIDKLISTGDIRPLVKRQTVINRNALLRQKSVIYSKRQEPEPVTKEVRIETFTHKDVVEAFEKHDIIDNYFNPENPKTETTNTPINSTPEPTPEPIALPADESNDKPTNADDLGSFPKSTKMQAAEKVLNFLQNNPNFEKKSTPKIRAEKWLKMNYKELHLVKVDGTINNQAIEEISKVVNPNTSGGAPKTY